MRGIIALHINHGAASFLCARPLVTLTYFDKSDFVETPDIVGAQGECVLLPLCLRFFASLRMTVGGLRMTEGRDWAQGER